MSVLPEAFVDLEPWVDDWAKPTCGERYTTRLSKTYDELGEFYDAVAARAEEAIAYLDGFELNDLPEDAGRLMQLMHSLILVSYAVNIFQQPRIPDSGSALFDMVAEPAV